MKVVFLDTTVSGTLIGGANTFLHKILSGLSNKNVEVHFVTRGKPSAKIGKTLEESGAIFHNRLWPEYSLVEDTAPILAEWLEKLNPDVFVVSVSPDIGWVVLPFLPPHIATVTIGHNDSDTFYEPAKHYADFLTKAIGVSEEICHNYVHKSGIREDRVIWIPYGVESEESGFFNRGQQGTQPLALVYVGRLVEEQKRSLDLIKIIQLLVQKQVRFQFKIIGDGPLFAKIEEQLSAEISQGIVQLTGWLTSEALMGHLRKSDVFILPSAYEGFCISLVEAMANGCTPVVTDIKSGNKQLVTNGENGYIVPVGDIEAFAEKIEWLSSHPAELLTFRQNAYKVGKMYSIERMVDQYYDCFKQVMEDVRKNPRQPDPDFPLMKSCRSKYPLWLRRAKLMTKRIKARVNGPERN